MHKDRKLRQEQDKRYKKLEHLEAQLSKLKIKQIDIENQIDTLKYLIDYH